MKNNAAVEVDEQTSAIFVEGEEEGSVGRGSDTRDVFGVLAGECGGFRLEEVDDRHAVARGREKMGIVQQYGVPASVRGAQQVLEPVIHCS